MGSFTTIAVVMTLTTAALVQGAIGFGYALVAMALLPFFAEVRHAAALVAITVALPLILNYMSVRSHAEWRKLGWLCLGIAPGNILGVLFLAKAPVGVVTRMLGVVVIMAVVQDWTIGKIKGRLPAWSGVVAGLISGMMAGAYGIGGPPLVTYALLVGWPKHEFKANLAVLFLVSMICRLPLMFAAGLFTREVLLDCVWCAPFVAVGSYIGQHLFERFSAIQFRFAMRILLLAIGINLAM